MLQDEARHAKRMEQILASIDEKLERIAKSLEKMEPTIHKVPRFDVPLDAPDVNGPADDLEYLTRITAEEDKIFKSNTTDLLLGSAR